MNWFDLVLPQLIRELKRGPVDPYWSGLQTEGYEVAFYVGTIPLILAFVALVAQPRKPADVAVEAHDPDLFRAGDFAPVVDFWLLAPDRCAGSGVFPRACSVHVVLQLWSGASGRGRSRSGDFQGAVSPRAGRGNRLRNARPRRGRALDDEIRRAPSTRALGVARWLSLVWPRLVVRPGEFTGMAPGRIGAWGLLVVSAIELALLFYHGTTDWGRAIELPGQSPVLDRARRPFAARFGRRRNRKSAGAAWIEDGSSLSGVCACTF